MKKILPIIAVLLVAALLLVSCASKENQGEKELTANDIEGRWTVDYESSTPTRGDLVGLEGFMVSTRLNDNVVVVFRGGKITAEWEEEDGKKTSDLGGYEVSEGCMTINGFRADPQLDGRKLTLSEFLPKEDGLFRKEDGVYKKVNDDGTTSEAIGDVTVMVLVRK